MQPKNGSSSPASASRASSPARGATPATGREGAAALDPPHPPISGPRVAGNLHGSAASSASSVAALGGQPPQGQKNHASGLSAQHASAASAKKPASQQNSAASASSPASAPVRSRQGGNSLSPQQQPGPGDLSPPPANWTRMPPDSDVFRAMPHENGVPTLAGLALRPADAKDVNKTRSKANGLSGAPAAGDIHEAHRPRGHTPPRGPNGSDNTPNMVFRANVRELEAIGVHTYSTSAHHSAMNDARGQSPKGTRASAVLQNTQALWTPVPGTATPAQPASQPAAASPRQAAASASAPPANSPAASPERKH